MTEDTTTLTTDKTITLTKGFETVVSDKDSDLAAMKWCVSTSSNRKTVYAYRAVTGDNRKKEYLGRVILARMLRDEGVLGQDEELPEGMTCSYRDKNPMNNKRENLQPKIKNAVSRK